MDTRRTRHALEGVSEDGREAQVRRLLKVLLSLSRQLFRFAIDREWIEQDPTAAIGKAATAGADVERKRVLSAAELRALPGKIAGARLVKATEHAVWVLMATCCRVDELQSAAWADVDLASGTWRIPETKNGKPHNVYLSAFATKHLRALKALAGGSAWVLPSSSAEDAPHVGPKTIVKQLSDRQRGDKPPLKNRAVATANALALPDGKWTPHDLRRTGATLMAGLGVRPDVIEKCLNHTEQNRMVRLYQHAGLEAEQAEAWRLLGDRLELLTGEHSNVVALPSRRA